MILVILSGTVNYRVCNIKNKSESRFYLESHNRWMFLPYQERRPCKLHNYNHFNPLDILQMAKIVRQACELNLKDDKHFEEIQNILDVTLLADGGRKKW